MRATLRRNPTYAPKSGLKETFQVDEAIKGATVVCRDGLLVDHVRRSFLNSHMLDVYLSGSGIPLQYHPDGTYNSNDNTHYDLFMLVEDIPCCC